MVWAARRSLNLGLVFKRGMRWEYCLPLGQVITRISCIMIWNGPLGLKGLSELEERRSKVYVHACRICTSDLPPCASTCSLAQICIVLYFM